MKRLVSMCLVIAAARGAAAQNLLVNGGFGTPAADVYFDGSDPSVADDVPGWLMYLGAADGSYVLVSDEMDPLASGADLDMGIGAAGGGIRTADDSRPAVTPLAAYEASMTSDNYFAASGGVLPRLVRRRRQSDQL
jgi:hypothetical protein